MSSSSVTPFSFDQTEVRVELIDDEPWFIAADICNALGITDTRHAVSRVYESDLQQITVTSGGQRRRMYAVNESGLYELVIRSDKPEARRFRHWITTDVLPSLRRTGAYQMVPVKPADDLAVLEGMIASIRESRSKIASLEVGQQALEAKVSASQGEHDEFTTLAYAKIHGLPTDRISCQRHGQRAARIMRQRGETPRKVQDSTFGSINVYPSNILSETEEA